MLSKSMVLLSLLIVFFAPSVSAKTIGELVNATESYLECNNLSWHENAICEKVAVDVNDLLNNSGVTFNNGSVERTVVPLVPPQALATGHSCSHTASVPNSLARITLNASGEFDFNGNSVSEPAIFIMRLPVGVYVKIDFKEQWGYRNIFGHCSEYATDNYYADLYANTIIHSAMLFSLEPKLLGKTPDGDYLIEISPVFHIDSSLESFSGSFNLNDQSPFSSVLTFISGSTTFVLSGSYSLLTWDKDRFLADLSVYGYDLAYTALHGITTLQDISGADKNFVEREVTKRVNTAAADFNENGMIRAKTELETKIYNQISNALQLNSEGRRTFIVKKEVVNAKLMAGILPALMLLQ